jgi:hypothetical protein
MVEARNALCVLSRRPAGFGLADSPVAGLAEDAGTAGFKPLTVAGEAERKSAIEQWQKEAVRNWQQWYLKYRPYEERDNLRSIP